MRSRQRPTGTARRLRRAVAAVLGLGLVVPVGVVATSAAWTDAAGFTAPVSAASTWPAEPPAPVGCQVLRASDGTVMEDIPCTVEVAGEPIDIAAPGRRTQKVMMTVGPARWVEDVVVRVTADLSGAVPGDWQWEGAFHTPNNNYVPGSTGWASYMTLPSCSNLSPTLYLPNWVLNGAPTEVLHLHEADPISDVGHAWSCTP
ncbi:hypothetical protein [Cellulomonas sp.]|uniref:hypothetical protein n=1 Tax=Cellulomonas sp. TaxID=40001 RepID=UPI002811AD89|nr:hypothetical protein [Cellulomonas sp.]